MLSIPGGRGKENLERILKDFCSTINGVPEMSRLNQLLAGDPGRRIGPFLNSEWLPHLGL